MLKTQICVTCPQCVNIFELYEDARTCKHQILFILIKACPPSTTLPRLWKNTSSCHSTVNYHKHNSAANRHPPLFLFRSTYLSMLYRKYPFKIRILPLVWKTRVIYQHTWRYKIWISHSHVFRALGYALLLSCYFALFLWNVRKRCDSDTGPRPQKTWI